MNEGDLHAHHIYSQEDYPELKDNPRNGVILCGSYHLTNERCPSKFGISLKELLDDRSID